MGAGAGRPVEGPGPTPIPMRAMDVLTPIKLDLRPRSVTVTVLASVHRPWNPRRQPVHRYPASRSHLCLHLERAGATLKGCQALFGASLGPRCPRHCEARRLWLTGNFGVQRRSKRRPEGLSSSSGLPLWSTSCLRLGTMRVVTPWSPGVRVWRRG